MPDYSKPKMIIPQPVMITCESGRRFEFYLEKKDENGVITKLNFDYIKKMNDRKELLEKNRYLNY